MKRDRGFRLGRRLAMVWRWAFRQRRSRCRPKHYLRLGSDDVAARYEAPPSVTAKLFGWTRHLARRLHCGKGCGSGSGRYRRLGDDRRLGAPLPEGPGGGDGWKKPPPKGFLAVYVGGKKEEEEAGSGGTPRRYLVPVIYFNHPLFGELLREAEEEFGFQHPGGITIPCPAAKFERIWTSIDAAAESLRRKSAKHFGGFNL